MAGYRPMRILSFRLIVALIFGVTLVSLGSSWYEATDTKDALRHDLEVQAETLGENLVGNAKAYMQTGDRAALEQMVQRFTNRDHLIGIGVYDSDGTPVVITPGLSSLLSGSPKLTQELLSTRRESKFLGLRLKRVHVLSVPLPSSASRSFASGVVSLFTSRSRCW
jgi:hypothetical protein